MRIKLFPSAVHSGVALASLLCAGKFKVGYFLDSLRITRMSRWELDAELHSWIPYVQIGFSVGVYTRRFSTNDIEFCVCLTSY